MKISDTILRQNEYAQLALRSLYQSHGYARFKVGKFEEYDLYARNKNFLISDQILTFTDTNGKLMALKPDVTLSIIKNIGDGENQTHKLYYNETVYRTSAGSDGFREIMQTGLECIGNIGLYDTAEVLMLAQKSLALISEDFILDVSHMGLVAGLLENTGLQSADTAELLRLIGCKNLPAMRALCAERGVNENIVQTLCKITLMYEPIEKALREIEPLIAEEKMQKSFEELSAATELLRAWGKLDRIYLDFSIVNDMNYYNGIIFRGFVNGIPDGILSGGRYDSLLAKMGKKGGAIGFAVYLDLLERLGEEAKSCDVDVLLVENGEATAQDMITAVKALQDVGNSVLVQGAAAADIRYRRKASVGKGGVLTFENHD